MESIEIEVINLKCTYKDCEKILSSKYNLKRHVESCHQGFRPYECKICFTRFSSKQNKRDHKRMKHPPSDILIPEKIENKITASNIEILKLSTMVKFSTDPDIRPFAKLERIYIFTDTGQEKNLPRISNAKRNNERCRSIDSLNLV